MKKEILIPCLLAIIGIILLAGGVSAYLMRTGTTSACEACGMEVQKDDPSTFSITTADGATRYGCCPICALAISIYYKDATVYGKCFACGKEVMVTVKNEALSSITPIGDAYNVSVIFGKACIRNKIVCCQPCANMVKTKYEWAKDLPLLTAQEAYAKAKAKVPEFTISPKPVKTPIITYALSGAGIALILSAPLTWKFIKRKAQKL